MYIASNETLQNSRGIISCMPREIRKYLFGINMSEAYEIRLRTGRPVMIYFPDGCYYLSRHGMLTQDVSSAVRVTKAQIAEAIEIASKSSVYSVAEEIRDGYITLNGGNRMGICGSAVLENGKITFLKDISALNYRIACEISGASDKIADKVITSDGVKNTLIISMPGAGKTTMLRDLIRRISEEGYNVSVIDERREIAAVHEGKPSFDLGAFTDVLSGAPKAEGMLMALRSMAPEVIATDEIGHSSDAEAIEKIINSGVKVIATIHGKNLEQVRERSELAGAMRFFETFIVLSRRCGAGTVEEVRTK